MKKDVKQGGKISLYKRFKLLDDYGVKNVITTSNMNGYGFKLNFLNEAEEQKISREELYYYFNKKEVIFLNQTHSDKVTVIDKKENYDLDADAMITNRANVVLAIVLADCNGVFIYDKENDVIAAIHAGRKGIFKNIIGKTISKMKIDFDSKGRDLVVCVSPSIRVCCYEVGDDVINIVKKLGYHSAIVYKDDKTYLDLIHIIKDELNKHNILEENIEIHPDCTCCTNDYYSYRRRDRGRFAVAISLAR